VNMEKNYLYFQPEYVSKFKCDGAKCNAHCCKGWAITIDEPTYKKYSKLADAKEITSHIKFNSELKAYVVTLDERNFCPMLTENNLCRLQCDYGEGILSVTCTTYPRITCSFGNFFERSLIMTCPVAAEMILFQEEPMKFKWLSIPEKIHNGGKIAGRALPLTKESLSVFFETQLAMISILQERRLSLDQRLITLGFFLDKLQELILGKADRDTLLNLIWAYKSEEFLVWGGVASLFPNFSGDAKNFLPLIMKLIGYTIPYFRGSKFFDALEKVLEIKPDEKGQVFIKEIIPRYERLEVDRDAFLEKYSTVLENYLVNELFLNCYPLRFINENITRNFAIFLISYKIFELIFFSAVQENLNSKDDILEIVDWFTNKMDHSKELYENFFELLKGIDDTFLLMTCLLRG